MSSTRIPQNLCTICLDNFESKILGLLEDCCHVFCLVCIKEWYKYNKNCPLCRMDFKEIVEVNSLTDIESVLRIKNQATTADSMLPSNYYIDCNVIVTFIQLQDMESVESMLTSSFQEVEVLQAVDQNRL